MKPLNIWWVLENFLTGRLLVYNGLDMRFSEVRIEPNPECPVCADFYKTEGVPDSEG